MVKTFYVMRHGQTRFNLQGRIQGACDSPLTELGIEQAKSARQHFKEEGITFTRVYSSTQERACDTAELATERTNYIRLKGLKEMDFGSYEAHQEYLNPPLHREDGLGYRDYFMDYGGESNVQVYERIAKTIREVLEQSSDEDQLLFVSHGAAITQFYRHATLNPLVPKKRLANCAIFKMTYDGKDIMVQSIYNPIEKEYIFERKENE
ncbi:Phosphoglycerate mutase family [Streptococcus macedonicus ACA-DC 198]|nr:Phosphoglycerate mutase family [Streptococcus macedonicus ACA-DC 198]